MKLLKKIGNFVSFVVAACVIVPFAAALACLAGLLVLWPISFFNETFTDALFGFGPVFGKFKIPVIVIVIGCVAIWIGARVAKSWKRERERATRLDEEKGRLHNFLADRKRWIIGLSLVALFLTGETAKNYIKYDKAFHKADRLATARIVEVDPGEPASGSGEDADPGSPPSSHYQFQVNGITYDGWIEDELSKDEQISIRYNSTDPKFNRARDDNRTFFDKEKNLFFLLFVVVAALAFAIWQRKPDEPEPEIDIGDGSFESLRNALIERVHRDPIPKEEAKLRKFADRIQKAKQQERIAIQKLSDATENYRD